MANNHDWALTVVGDLLDGFDADPEASVLGLLTLGYGQSVPALLRARWSDVDLLACVWRIGGEALELTAPFRVLLERFRVACPSATPDDYMFTGPSGGLLSRAELNARVLDVLREFFALSDLRKIALKVCPDLAGAEWRAKIILRSYAHEGAPPEKGGKLERFVDAKFRALVEGYHDDSLCLTELMANRGWLEVWS